MDLTIPLAHMAHDLAYALPVLVAIVVVTILAMRDGRRAAPVQDDDRQPDSLGPNRVEATGSGSGS
jgi:hypothetical protein